MCFQTGIFGYPPETITYPTKREKDNHHLQKWIGGGYVSSMEGHFIKPLVRDVCF